LAKNRGKVVVAMSGGVDSSVVACLLHEQGYDVTGLFMRTGIENAETVDGTQPGANCTAGDEQTPVSRHRGCCSAADASDARVVAGKLGIPFFAMNFKDSFDRIIEHFIDEYQRGRTPNPCVMCNEQLKFGRLWDYGRLANADFIATGHYAQVDHRDGQYRLRRAVDQAKDQSYVLFGIGRHVLSQTLFPIGGMQKDEVRRHARRFGLAVSEKSESQDICFVPDRNYARLIRERRPECFTEGAILDMTGQEVGRHDGIANFTIGQRRGLGIAMGQPVYVIRIDVEANTVTVGTKDHLASDTLEASDVKWLVDPLDGPSQVAVKIRYAHQAAPAMVEPMGNDRVRIRFQQPQMAITPGQAAVFYDDDIVLGGGWID